MKCAAGVVLLGASLLWLGCAENEEQRSPAAVAPVGESIAVVPPFEGVDPGYGPEVQSLRLLRSIVVRSAPDQSAAPLGTVAQDTRVSWSRAARGDGCEGLWMEIDPRGWVCDQYLEPNFRPPRALELPKLREENVVPGTYGKVRGARTRAFRSPLDARRGVAGTTLADATMVRFLREVSIGRRRFWKTSTGQLVDARKILPRDPSQFSGVDLLAPRAPLLPFAFVHSPTDVTVWEESMRWIEVGKLPPRAVVPVMGRSKDGTSIRIARHRWVEAEKLRVATLVSPPPELGPNEKWIDVDLAEQVLVAYEGARPIFATLVSTGTRNPTPTGTWRIWIKFAERQMSGELNGRSYLVEDVPWIMFFHGDFALHAAYWHDKFGDRASNGCINLAPKDARFLYQWSAPEVSLGWSMAYATEDTPGTLIRVRNGPPDSNAIATAMGSR